MFFNIHFTILSFRSRVCFKYQRSIRIASSGASYNVFLKTCSHLFLFLLCGTIFLPFQRNRFCCIEEKMNSKRFLDNFWPIWTQGVFLGSLNVGNSPSRKNTLKWSIIDVSKASVWISKEIRQTYKHPQI